jgi:hypothetical protein
MSAFSEFVKLKELAAYDVGKNILGRMSLDSHSEDALSAALQAFEIIMSKNSTAAIQFLHRMATSIPELQGILSQHNFDSFRDSDFRTDMRRAATRGKKVVLKGLGDMSAADTDDDVIANNSSDSYHNPMG